MILRLKKNFVKNGVQFVEIDRVGDFAIYETYARLDKSHLGYEVIKIKNVSCQRLIKSLEARTKKLYPVDGEFRKYQYKELYPTDKEFGSLGWFFMPKQKDKAWEKFKSLWVDASLNSLKEW